MQQLNFPKFKYRFKNTENIVAIFDVIRKKFVTLQPEEWVRQHCVHFLINEKKYPASLINVEKSITVNGLQKRYDIVVFDTKGAIHILVECKAPEVSISQHTFDQIARYNMVLNASFLMVTNGLNHYFCKIDKKAQSYKFLEELPQYKTN